MSNALMGKMTSQLREREGQPSAESRPHEGEVRFAPEQPANPRRARPVTDGRERRAFGAPNSGGTTEAEPFVPFCAG